VLQSNLANWAIDYIRGWVVRDYYAAVLIGRIAGLFRPCVCLSNTRATSKQKGVENKIGRSIPQGEHCQPIRDPFKVTSHTQHASRRVISFWNFLA